jgi:hypothetical protein
MQYIDDKTKKKRGHKNFFSMQYIDDKIVKFELSPFLGIEETQKMILVSKKMKAILEDRLCNITEKEVCHYVDYKVAQDNDEWSNNLILSII